MNSAPIVLLTDFGDSHYAGQVKGAISTIAPAAAVVDLTHGIRPQDVVHGAMVLAESVGVFPAGSIFVCVVDPGVGTARRGVALVSGGYTFVGPDNGLMYPATRDKIEAAVELEKKEFFRPAVSATFHGRDIFAPVAAHLWRGTPLSSLGRPVETIGALEIPAPEVKEGRIDGRVIYADRFGNLVTNVGAGLLGGGRWAVEIKGRRIKGVSGTYADAEKGRLEALIGSSGMLEVAVAGGSAEQRLHVKVPSAVRVRLKKCR